MTLYSLNSKTFDIVKAKKDLIKSASIKVKENKIIEKTDSEIDSILAKMTAEGVAPDEIEKEMEKYGVYKLHIPEETQTQFALASVSNSDVAIDTPSIYLHTTSNQWIVSGGGRWINDNWLQNVSDLWFFYAGTGDTYNIGGTEAFGIGYTNTSGTYSTKVNSVYAYLSDGLGNQITTTSRSDGDGSKGVGFQLQDYARCRVDYANTKDANSLSYIGKNFSCVVRYDYNFVSYDGIATSYYAHTYDQAVVNGVTFGVSGKTAGVSFDIANAQYSFPAFGADTRF